MNSKVLSLLGAVVVVLVTMLVFLEMNGQADKAGDGELLFSDLKKQVNDIDTLSVRYPEDTEPVTLGNASGRWSVANRNDYPADVGKVRAVLLAMADARIIEAKTANPDLYGRLGLRSPDSEGSKGVLVSASYGNNKFEVIFGNVAQSSYRYARIPDRPQTWLIDQNPDIPRPVGDWLLNDLLDIDPSRIRQATITHADGDSIRISKESSEDSRFVVDGIPEGRELSYSGVGDGIAGALKDLTLEDVRRVEESDDAVVTVFDTFDGVSVTVNSVKENDQSWISLSAVGGDDNNEEVSSINERVAGWQFRIADYKSNLLTRRWEDILKAKDE
jgi:hypothetical protein